jgi:hypothetical protein
LDARLRLAPWRLHDIRRSVATGMAEIGIQPHIIEAVLNHVSGHKAGVAGVYNRATYLPEKTAALTQWAEHLQAVVAGEVGEGRVAAGGVGVTSASTAASGGWW